MNQFPVATEWRDPASWKAEREASAPIAATAASSGYCSLCARESVFAWNPEASPRENLACRRCGCIGRERATAAVLLGALVRPRVAVVYATEHASRFHLALRQRVRRLRGSEYQPSLNRRLRLSRWLWRNGVADWVRHGDVTVLPFRDAAFDGVVSQDVLEHVPDYRAGLREIARVLKPGAPFVLTVPFYDAQPGNVQVASLDAAGVAVHSGEPEYHGDPHSDGVLCFRHFGWALLDDLRIAGFADAAAHRVRDPAFGLPHPLWVLRATR